MLLHPATPWISTFVAYVYAVLTRRYDIAWHQNMFIVIICLLAQSLEGVLSEEADAGQKNAEQDNSIIPCNKCGGEGRVYYMQNERTFGVKCTSCGKTGGEASTIDDAIDIWNKESSHSEAA